LIGSWGKGILCAGIVLLGLGGCGTNVGGGGATETGNGFSLEVVDAAGRLAPFANVQFVRTDSWLRDVAISGYPIVLGIQADASGKVWMDSLPSGSWAVQSCSGTECGLVSLDPTVSHASLHLAPSVSLNGIASDDSVTQVRVVGTAWVSAVTGSRRFQIQSAAGTLALVAPWQQNVLPLGTLAPSPGDTLSVSLPPTQNSVMIDDFSDGDRKTAVYRYTGIGNWYVTSDTGTRIWSATDSTGPDFQGSLSFQYRSQDTVNGYAEVGISFVDNAGYHDLDLSGMDSLCFSERGNGQLGVAIQRISGGTKVASIFAQAPGLTSGWQRVCLTPSSFGGWSTLATTGNDIGFVANQGDSVEIGPIEIWGVPLQDLSP
jgi:hypothetical protein